MKKWLFYPAFLSSRHETWFNRRSGDHFARQMDDLTDLKPSLQAVFRQSLRSDDQIRSIIYAPYQGILKYYKASHKYTRFLLPWELTPNWVLVLTMDRILLARINDSGITPDLISIPIESILYLQTGIILLFAWFEINWIDQGTLRKETVYFNAVCERFFNDLAEKIRCDIMQRSGLFPSSSNRNLSVLDGLPYKFMNMIPHRLLLADEQIVHILYFPILWKKSLGFFKKVLAPRTALVLTNAHLIVAEEDIAGPAGGYGLISTFIPRGNLCQISVRSGEINRDLILSLFMLGIDKEIRFPFPADITPAVNQFISAFTGAGKSS